MQGFVTYIHPAKPFGFVVIDGGMSWFFHLSQTIGPVSKGDEVEFWLDDSRDGRMVAVEVKRLGRPEDRP
jgi:cold shock CspA family protein